MDYPANHGSDMATSSKQKPSVAAQIIAVVGGLVGVAVGRLAGLALLIPCVGALVVGVPLYFVTSGRSRQMVPAGALQAGHALWIMVAVIVFANAGVPAPLGIAELLIEAVLFFAAAIAVVLYPSLIPVAILTAYQAAALVVNVLTAMEPAVPRELRPSLIVHIFLRIVGVVLMYEAYFRRPAEDRTTEDRATEDAIEAEEPAEERPATWDDRFTEKPALLPPRGRQLESAGATADHEHPHERPRRQALSVPVAAAILAAIAGAGVIAGLVRGPLVQPDQRRPPKDDPPPVAVWQEFTSPEFGFSVSLPGTPKHSSGRAPNSPRTNHAFQAADANGEYSIVFIDPPQPGRRAHLFQTLRALRQDFPLGQIAPEKPIKLGAYQGWEFTIGFADRTIVERRYRGHGRDYTLRFSTARLGATAADASDFFESFKPQGADQPALAAEPGRPPRQEPPPRILEGAIWEIISLTFSRDGRTLRATTHNGCVCFWDLASPMPVTDKLGQRQHPQRQDPQGLKRYTPWDDKLRMLTFALSPDGETAAVSALAGPFYLSDKHLVQRRLIFLEGLTPQIAWSLAWSPDARYLAAGHGEQTVKLWDTNPERAKGGPIPMDPANPAKYAVPKMPLWERASDGLVNSLAFTSDGKMLALGTHSNTITLCHADTGAGLATLKGGPGGHPSAAALWALAISANGNTLAAGGNDRTVRLWNLATRKEFALLPHSDTVRSLAFSPDDTLLATGDDAGNVMLWDTVSGLQKAVFPAPNGAPSVRAVAFASEANLLAAASGTEVRLWDLSKAR